MRFSLFIVLMAIAFLNLRAQQPDQRSPEINSNDQYDLVVGLDAVEAALLRPQVEYTQVDADAQADYVSLIDEKTWMEKRTDSAFRGSLGSKLGFSFSADSSFKDFEQARRHYFENTNYHSNANSHFLTMRKYLTDKQIEAFTRYEDNKRGNHGVRIVEKGVTNTAVSLLVVWVPAPGLPADGVDVSGYVVGGSSADADVQPNKLFRPNEKLNYGAKAVLLKRSPTEDITVSVTADEGRFSDTYTLLSTASMSIKVSTPVGTIVASMLPPALYGNTVGQHSGFDPKTSAWYPADGSSVNGSRYADLISTRVPDLRGMFLRGLNTFQLGFPPPANGDSDFNRTPGSYQSDEFKKHDHGGGNHTHQHTGDKWWAVRDGTWGIATIGDASPVSSPAPSPSTSIIKPEGGDETRPRNIAVYYYIRIN